MDPVTIAANIRRLRVARKPKITQREVAEHAGISKVEFIRIEKGQIASPRVTTLQGIADALGVKLQELLIPVRPLKSVRFRSRKRMKERENILANVSRWLDDYVELEQITGDVIPDMLKDIGQQNDPVEAAREARLHLGLDDDEPICDICGLLESAGVKIHTVSVQSSEFFGLSVDDHGPAVVVNVWDKISVERWIFTAAHEFGHLLLHMDAFDAAEEREEDEEEREANLFASHFLMPQRKFQMEWERTRGNAFIDRVLKVKRILRVSYGTVIHRLIELKYVDGRDVWRDFFWSYKKRYGKSLTRKEEPEGMEATDFAPEPRRQREPAALDAADFVENRLSRLVRTAVENDLITVSRAGEILQVPVRQMREIMRDWALEEEYCGAG